MFKTIEEIDIKDKRVFIRVDYNVKMKNGVIVDDTRLRESIPTVQYALEHKAKVILASHLGRPEGKRDEKYSLLPIAQRLSELLNHDVIFPEDSIGDGVKKLVTDLRDGQVILLENLRFHPEEEANDPIFAEKLASLAEVYINDAFGAAHREHASTFGMVSHFKEKGIGFLMKKEIAFLEKLLTHPEKPYLCILGGAKVSDKIGVIENLLGHVSTFLIGGGMAYTFLKARGVKVGNSLVEKDKIHQAERILDRAEVRGIEICLPVDSIVAEKFEKDTPWKILTNDDDWGQGMGLDIGPKTIEMFADRIKKAKTIFWNGPMGVFEIPPFDKGTRAVACLIADQRNALSVAGGGDSLAAIHQSGYEEGFAHLSTGGGASMEFLEGKMLPGLKVLALHPSNEGAKTS